MSGISRASQYEKNSQPQWAVAIENLNDFPIQPTDCILDVGCGDGKMSAYLANKVSDGEVIGLDISKEMIALASSKHHLKNLKFILQDGAAPNISKLFNKVVLLGSFHWIKKQQQALRNYEKLLKPGGQLLIVTPLKDLTNFHSIFKRVIQKKQSKPFFSNYKDDRFYIDQNDAEKLVKNANMKLDSCQIKEVHTHFSSSKALQDWFIPLITQTDHLTVQDQRELCNDILEEVSELHTKNLDGSIDIQSKALTIMASKPL